MAVNIYYNIYNKKTFLTKLHPTTLCNPFLCLCVWRHTEPNKVQGVHEQRDFVLQWQCIMEIWLLIAFWVLSSKSGFHNISSTPCLQNVHCCTANANPNRCRERVNARSAQLAAVRAFRTRRMGWRREAFCGVNCSSGSSSKSTLSSN